MPAHSGINIGILGNISLIPKGRLIVDQMCRSLPSYPDVRIVVLGNYVAREKCKQLRVRGHYKRTELPSLVEKDRIDIIFIPSVCPETFSYTTAEAMCMEVPVACFALGAPYERVRTYDKGIIIHDMEPEKILDKIVELVLQMRQSAN